MELLKATLNGKKVRSVTHLGREFYVAPMTMIMPDAVLNGSDGAILYPEEENRKSADLWNGMPIVVYHPTAIDENGRVVPVSARDPDILEAVQVGNVYRARCPKGGRDKGKLRAEGWFDKERTKQVDTRVLNALEKGLPLELSTGLFLEAVPVDPDDPEKTATINGVSYKATARKYKPDHLAVLPDMTGACSIKQGCGILVNSCGCLKVRTEELETGKVEVDRKSGPKTNSDIDPKLLVNGLTYSEIHEHVSKAIREKLQPNGRGEEYPSRWYYVLDVTEEFAVYTEEYRSNSKLYKIDYSIDDVGKVTFSGEPKRVMVRKEFVEIEDEPIIINDDKTPTVNPLPNEHSARMQSPSLFDPHSFKRKKISKGVSAIFGKKKSKGVDAPMQVQSYRFDAEMFSEGECAQWLSEHNRTPKSFEPASGIVDPETKKTINTTTDSTDTTVTNEETEMPLTKTQKIDSLITNCDCWEESDRKTLEGFGDEKLDKLLSLEKKDTTVQPTPAPTANASAVQPTPTPVEKSKGKMSMDDWLEQAPDEVVTVVRNAAEADLNRRKELSVMIANHLYPTRSEEERKVLADELVAEPTKKLEKMAADIPTEMVNNRKNLRDILLNRGQTVNGRTPSYVGAGTSTRTLGTDEEDEPLGLPTYNFRNPRLSPDDDGADDVDDDDDDEKPRKKK